MKNIILQHWTGDLNKLAELSSANIEKYALSLGADYMCLRGDVFRNNLQVKHPPLQKLAMLNEEFDNYDMTVMLDMDMFTRKGMTENIFTGIKGIGVHTEVQERLVKDMERLLPKISNSKYCYWGGSVCRLTREQRQTLRSHIVESEIPLFCSRQTHGDEGLMHTLAVRAKYQNMYLPDTRWNYPSFWVDIKEKAQIIHIRTKVTEQGPKREKIDNLMKLVEQGLIEI